MSWSSDSSVSNIPGMHSMPIGTGVPPRFPENPNKGTFPRGTFRSPPRGPRLGDNTSYVSGIPPTGQLSRHKGRVGDVWDPPVVAEAADPRTEGTAQAFGGTAGRYFLPFVDPSELPSAADSPPRPNRPTGDAPLDESLRTAHILNRNTLFTLSDYEIIALGKQAEKLQEFGDAANASLQQRAHAERFFNLPLGEIFARTAATVIAVFTDLLHFFRSERAPIRAQMNYQEYSSQLAQIVLKQDRLLYLGVFAVFLSLVFMVIFLSS